MEVISQISLRLGIRSADFASINAMFVKEADNAYKILEISRSASDEEVKKAYREMAM
jgi:DnaJ like chaperone protein